MYRATQNNDVTIYRTFYVGSVATQLDVVPTVSVTTSEGTVLAAPTATDEATPGEYSIVLTAAAHTASLDTLAVVWTGDHGGLAVSETQYIDVVGGRYFQLGDLRSMDGITSTQKYSDLYLERVRVEVEDLFEHYLETSYVPRHNTDIFDSGSFYKNGGTISYGQDHLLAGAGQAYGVFLRKTPVTALTAIFLAGVSQTLGDWVVTKSGHARSEGFTPDDLVLGQDLSISYTHGHSHLPADLQRAALRFARQTAIANVSTVPDRARLMQSEFGLFVLDAAGHEKPTGSPEIDTVLNRYRHEGVGSFA